MAIARKPTVRTVDEFINAADSHQRTDVGPIMEDLSATPEAIQQVRLRLPAELVNQIDESIKRKRSILSRHQWILEALYEKLDREEAATKTNLQSL
jgi:hypothetical protein